MTTSAEPSTPSGSAAAPQRRRQITSYKSTTSSPATDSRTDSRTDSWTDSRRKAGCVQVRMLSDRSRPAKRLRKTGAPFLHAVRARAVTCLA